MSSSLTTSVIDIEDLGKQKRIICSDGSVLNTDFVVIGVGIKPNIELAKSSGLECDNGIIVDEIGRTSDHHIFAVGDCSNHPNNIFKQRLRLESVQNAVEQAKSIAASIAGSLQTIPRGSMVLVGPIQHKAPNCRDFTRSYDQSCRHEVIQKKKNLLFFIKKKNA